MNNSVPVIPPRIITFTGTKECCLYTLDPNTGLHTTFGSHILRIRNDRREETDGMVAGLSQWKDVVAAVTLGYAHRAVK